LFFWVANFSAGGIRNESDTTILYARKALNLDPDYPYALLILGGALLKKDDLQAAHDVAMHYRDVRPNDVYPYEFLGDILRREGQFDSARVWYETALRIAPDQRNGYRELARVFVLQGQPDSAIEWYSKTLASENAMTRNLALRSIGDVHAAWGRFDRAAEYYRKAATMSEAAHLSQQAAGAYQSLGQLYLDTRRPEEALREFVKLAKIDTIGPDAEIYQAVAYCYLNNPDKARSLVAQVSREWAGRIDSMLLLAGTEMSEASIALQEKRYQEAIDHFERARHYQNDSTSSRDDFAEALIAVGRYDDALRELKRLRKDAELAWPDNQYMRGLYLQADALVKSGRSKDAVEPLQRLMVFWGSTDWSIPWLDDAKKLYASLTAQ
jgi:tetratricopeptide (TPR) repeat protein